MMFPRVVLSVLCGLIVAAAADPFNPLQHQEEPKYKGPSYVVQLTSSNFTQFVKSNSRVLLGLMMPGCGACETMAPALAEISARARSPTFPAPVVVATVDGPREEMITRRFQFSGYPSVFLIREGIVDQPAEYESMPNADELERWLTYLEEPPIIDLTGKSQEDIEKYLQQKRAEADEEDDWATLLVGYVVEYGPEHGLLQKLTVQLWAEYWLRVAVVFVKSLSEQKLVIHRMITDDDDDKYVEPPPKPWTVEALEQAVRTARFPLVGTRFNPESYLLEDKIVSAVIRVANQRMMNEYMHLIRKIARKYEEVKFVFADDSKEDDQFAFDLLGTPKVIPSITVVDFFSDQDSTMNRKYFYSGAFTEDKLDEFFRDWRAKHLDRFIRSQPLPQDTSTPLKDIVADNFRSVILGSQTPAIVLYYDAACETNEVLQPLFEKAAKEVEASEQAGKVVIARMDTSSNDVEDEKHVTMVPAIVVYPEGHEKMRRAVGFSSEATGVHDYADYLQRQLKALGVGSHSSRDEL